MRIWRAIRWIAITGVLFGLVGIGDARCDEEDSKAAALRLIAIERDHSQVVDNLAYLSDVIGPRLTGSKQLLQANDWTARKMTQYGLENVHLEAHVIPKGWVRGEARARMIYPHKSRIDCAQVAWTQGTGKTISGKVVVFAPANDAEMQRYKGKLHGAIVLTSKDYALPKPEGYMFWTLPVDPGQVPAFKKEVPEKQTERSPAKSPRESPGFQKRLSRFMVAQGVAAIFHDARKPLGLLNMWGSWEGQREDTSSRIPSLIVSNDHIAMLHRLLERGITPRVEFRTIGRFIRGPLRACNTMGEIRGSEKPDEVVLVGGHLDSWDLGEGTTDNGTGSMVVLEAARLLKAAGIRPRRTIRFVLFAGEEEAMSGSQDYLKKHKSELGKMQAVFVHDTGTGRVRGISLQDRPECKPILERQFNLLDELGLFSEKPRINPGKDPGSDHDTFDDVGIPAFTFDQFHAEYGLSHHSQADTMERVRPHDLKQGACVAAILAYDSAQMVERFPRKPAKK